MRYSDDIIEEVRMKNDIVDVVSQYVKLNKRGSTYFGLCPFHNEKTPSFSVTPAKQMYYCFGCGAGGNVFNFVMEYENYTFGEALKHLADRAGVQLPKIEYSGEAKKKAEEEVAAKAAQEEAERKAAEEAAEQSSGSSSSGSSYYDDSNDYSYSGGSSSSDYSGGSSYDSGSSSSGNDYSGGSSSSSGDSSSSENGSSSNNNLNHTWAEDGAGRVDGYYDPSNGDIYDANGNYQGNLGDW